MIMVHKVLFDFLRSVISFVNNAFFYPSIPAPPFLPSSFLPSLPHLLTLYQLLSLSSLPSTFAPILCPFLNQSLYDLTPSLPLLLSSSSSSSFSSPLCSHRVVDALPRGVAVGSGVAHYVTSYDSLIDVQDQTNHNLDQYRHKQVTVNSRPVVLETPGKYK